eukprot:m.281294 g.281294  ORF g.281294 m.281294 type:complete len:74 (-) comp19836_c0_seq5:354-575(-)
MPFFGGLLLFANKIRGSAGFDIASTSTTETAAPGLDVPGNAGPTWFAVDMADISSAENRRFRIVRQYSAEFSS